MVKATKGAKSRRPTQSMLATATAPQFGRTPNQFAKQVGLGRSTLYNLPADCQPDSFKIGKRVVVIEDPATWIARMKARGGTHTVRHAAPARQPEAPAPSVKRGPGRPRKNPIAAPASTPAPEAVAA